VTGGQRVGQPTSDSRSGYTFLGWYTAASGGSAWDFNRTVTQNMTLYSRFVAASVPPKTPPPGQGTLTKNPDGSYTAKAKTGYTFTGWYDASGKRVSTKKTYTPVKAGIVPKFTAVKVTVKFNAKGGKVKGKKKVTLAYGKKITAPKATRKGYVFKGWFKGKQKFKKGAKALKNVTYAAKWAKKK
jgi:uncharacterized repeat protein (TIGR02543 family)